MIDHYLDGLIWSLNHSFKHFGLIWNVHCQSPQPHRYTTILAVGLDWMETSNESNWAIKITVALIMHTPICANVCVCFFFISYRLIPLIRFNCVDWWTICYANNKWRLWKYIESMTLIKMVIQINVHQPWTWSVRPTVDCRCRAKPFPQNEKTAYYFYAFINRTKFYIWISHWKVYAKYGKYKNWKLERHSFS